MTRVAVVVQRYGPEVLGGAETAARAIAEQLARHMSVTVITTCAVDYTTWENIYPPGESELNGVSIQRFPVDEPRDWQRSRRETGLFLQQERSLEEELAWVRREGPFSTPLLQYIYQSAETYDIFLFFTYLYATTVFGLPLVADKAVLVPTAHDEPFLYMEIYRRICRLPQRLVYLTHAERDVVNRITGNGARISDVIGLGIEIPTDASPERFRKKYGVQGDFLLYAGRISEAKNVPELLDFFARYRLDSEQNLKLVLLGEPSIPLPDDPDVIPLGFVSESDKFDALSAATVVVLPSKFESLSIIILEAWAMGTPVVVNGHSVVTRKQCQLSNGGLYYVSYAEYASIMERLLATPSLRESLGKQGREFVTRRYTWDAVLVQYETLFRSLRMRTESTNGTN